MNLHKTFQPINHTRAYSRAWWHFLKRESNTLKRAKPEKIMRKWRKNSQKNSSCIFWKKTFIWVRLSLLKRSKIGPAYFICLHVSCKIGPAYFICLHVSCKIGPAYWYLSSCVLQDRTCIRHLSSLVLQNRICILHLSSCFLQNRTCILIFVCKIGPAYWYLSSFVLQNRTCILILVFICRAKHMRILGTVLLTTESFIKLQENHFV